MFRKALSRESRRISVHFFFFCGCAIVSFWAFATRNLAVFFEEALLATRRPTPGNTNSPVFSDRSASKESSLATFFDTPSVLAAFAADGNPVFILIGMRILLAP